MLPGRFPRSLASRTPRAIAIPCARANDAASLSPASAAMESVPISVRAFAGSLLQRSKR